MYLHTFADEKLKPNSLTNDNKYYRCREGHQNGESMKLVLFDHFLQLNYSKSKLVKYLFGVWT